LKNMMKIDRRITALLLTVAAIIAIKISIDLLPPQTGKTQGEPKQAAVPDERKYPATRAEKEVDRRFKQAVAMLHAKRYEHAVTALQRVLKLAPEMPEAWFSLLQRFLFPQSSSHYFQYQPLQKQTGSPTSYHPANPLQRDSEPPKAGPVSASLSERLRSDS